MPSKAPNSKSINLNPSPLPNVFSNFEKLVKLSLIKSKFFAPILIYSINHYETYGTHNKYMKIPSAVCFFMFDSVYSNPGNKKP
jgi:hypothetical protein